MKLNVRKWPILNVCYADNACGRVSSRGQLVELDLGVQSELYSIHVQVVFNLKM